MPTPPAQGEVQPGQLLVDPQTLTIWVGVDTSVDPNGSLLVCDMQTLAQVDAANLQASKQYTDNMLNGTLAPNGKAYTQVGHKHDVTDINNFDQAVKTAVGETVLPKGTIIMWSGAASQVGTGKLADWAVCNGAFNEDWGTQVPNLVNKFIIASDNTVGNHAWVAPGTGSDETTSNPPTVFRKLKVFSDGAHGHGDPSYSWEWTYAHKLSEAEMPKHNHGFYKASETQYKDNATFAVFSTQLGVDNNVINDYALTAGTNLTNDFATAYMAQAGSDAAHRHQISYHAGHQHDYNCSYQNVPYFALIYIIKVK